MVRQVSPYRDAPPVAPPVDRYLAAWERLAASRSRAGWGAFLGVSAAIVGGGLLSLVSHGAAAAFVAVTALAIGAGLESQRFSCPRCEKPFFRDGKRRAAPAEACVHCGLRIGAREADETAKGTLAGHAEK